MKLVLLGTGTSQGIPIIGCKCKVCLSQDIRDKRLRSSLYLETDQVRLLIDCGPDFRQQALSNNIQHLSAVLLTHEHTDHMMGMDDLRPFIFRQQKGMPIYAHERVIKAVQRVFSYAFHGDYPGTPKFVLHSLKGDVFTVEGVEIQPIRAKHASIEVYGYRIGRMAYLTDFKSLLDNEIEKLKGLDVLIVSCLRKKEHYSHIHLPEVLKLIDEIKPRMSYLTHISHEFGLYEEETRQLPENVLLANDNLIINL